jgi:hypothetical protein
VFVVGGNKQEYPNGEYQAGHFGHSGFSLQLGTAQCSSRRAIFFIGATGNDPQRVVGQRAL